MTDINTNPHGNTRVLLDGAPLESAQAALILIHGRGATAESILRLGPQLLQDVEGAENIALLAPQASDNTWYPYRFIAPLEQNEPWLSSALGVIDELVDTVTAAGIDSDKIMIAGFSQGACLSLEYAARATKPIGAVAGFSGGLIGPVDEPHAPLGDVKDLPVFLGTGTVDDHVSPEQVRESARLFEEAGAAVDLRIYEGMEHTINDHEVEAVRGMISTLTTR